VLRSLVRLAETVRKAPPKPRLRKAAVELTDTALQRIKELLENRHKVLLVFFWILVVFALAVM